ncbi:MotA/TolQ/ExbB proton channel family protein [Puniceicoccales bacterium CK1056]|uniref:MotA/TolQ/ExbB proton channel family protein n=2 Tax=Oceanipulchritudo coccoides TaxID=2706888 RepID=A0A6B2M3G8_9BACT|nr:MotA/TolQ/ExbB proton channel family protein [Oceanipulchritudo coccoides]
MGEVDFSLIEQGGPMMWVLLAVSLFGFIIFIERTLFLHRGQLRTGQFLEGIRNLVSRGRRLEALTLCEDMPGPIPGIVKAILLQAGASESKMRTVAEEAALVEIPILERRIGSIAAIARIAPLIGLLGTVLGMLQAFFGVPFSETVGYPTFGLLLGGIGQALLTTAFGLMIAIMAHIAHHFLHGRVRALVHDMEYTGHDLIQFMQQEQTDGGLPDEETQEPEADQ